jgi:septal ring factor EnvC (AmiA/AmiB activator)
MATRRTGRSSSSDGEGAEIVAAISVVANLVQLAKGQNRKTENQQLRDALAQLGRDLEAARKHEVNLQGTIKKRDDEIARLNAELAAKSAKLTEAERRDKK